MCSINRHNDVIQYLFYIELLINSSVCTPPLRLALIEEVQKYFEICKEEKLKLSPFLWDFLTFFSKQEI